MSRCPADDGELTHMVILVTGGGTGIGAAITARLADEGACVVIAQRTPAEAARHAAALAQTPRRISAVGADLATADGCRALVAATLDEHGRIDALINNAAVCGPAALRPFLEYEDSTLDQVIDVNLKAAFRCTREAAPHMPPGGVVVNITSVAAYAAQLNASAYVAAKSGLVGLTKAIALELAPRKIRVAHVAPGDVAADNGDEPQLPDQSQWWARRTPLGRRGIPNDIAAAVAWLCSPEAAFITGTGIVVDGGWTSY